MDIQLKEVYFDNFCSQCEFKNNAENQTPCDECLEEPVNEFSHKPVKFKRKDS